MAASSSNCASSTAAGLVPAPSPDNAVAVITPFPEASLSSIASSIDAPKPTSAFMPAPAPTGEVTNSAAAVMTQSQLYFRLSSEREPSSRFKLATLGEVRWIAIIREAAIGSQRFVLRIFDQSGTAADAAGSVLALGSSAEPGVRVGGSLSGVAQKIKRPGSYEARLMSEGRVLASAELVLE